MAIKFQYNKTSLQSLDKQLKMRVRALPTIKNKESALRSEVKKAKEEGTEVAKVMEYCRQNMIIDIKDNENNSAYTVAWKYRSGFVQKTGRSETTGCHADFCKKAGCQSL